jgi:hypothetical protein
MVLSRRAAANAASSSFEMLIPLEVILEIRFEGTSTERSKHTPFFKAEFFKKVADSMPKSGITAVSHYPIFHTGFKVLI